MRRSGRGVGRSNEKRTRHTQAGTAPPGQLKAKHGEGHGARPVHGTQPVHGNSDHARGRGSVQGPSKDTPVRRRRPDSKAKAEHAKPAPEVASPPKADSGRQGAGQQGAGRHGPKPK